MIITQYSIRVSAENALGEGEPSGKQTVKTLQEAPEGGQSCCFSFWRSEGGRVVSHFGDQGTTKPIFCLAVKVGREAVKW